METDKQPENARPAHFIRQIIAADVTAGKNGGRVATRFPPEPNGYLHIGHAKSICLNFGMALEFGGTCNLRFDDTNPHKESVEYVEAIERDVRWMGFEWAGLYFASDYFEQLYQFAIELIERGKAYVDDLTADEIREYRGTLTEPGRNSPYRDRSVAENLDLFRRMRAGEFPDGARVLRARIDMASPNINMRDPTLYRIRHGVVHHHIGEAWCIYPTYDYAHPISDALEGITHSLCTLEFEDHRPLYDWVLDNITVSCHPQQIEFSRLNLQYTVMSKRRLTRLVDEGFVEGWDDPRMPTIAGLRRRGYTPSSIRDFAARIGVTKADNVVELAMLENCIREELNARAPRRMAVLHPLRVILKNYPEDRVEQLEAPNHPQDHALGTRRLPFCRELYIDREDFMEQPVSKFKRLVPGGEVRLRYGYVIRCEDVIKDGDELVELHCTYDPATLGSDPVGRKIKGVIHWVSARHAVGGEVRLYDRLFTHPLPDAAKEEGKDFTDFINPDSLRTLATCMFEPALARAAAGESFQFEREGYFVRDIALAALDRAVFNRTVTLRDTWAKIAGGER